MKCEGKIEVQVSGDEIKKFILNDIIVSQYTKSLLQLKYVLLVQNS